jgi:hypothetical protein
VGVRTRSATVAAVVEHDHPRLEQVRRNALPRSLVEALEVRSAAHRQRERNGSRIHQGGVPRVHPMRHEHGGPGLACACVCGCICNEAMRGVGPVKLRGAACIAPPCVRKRVAGLQRPELARGIRGKARQLCAHTPRKPIDCEARDVAPSAQLCVHPGKPSRVEAPMVVVR